ncbi:uncharacterized protein TNCV_3452671 [Trichonephila clavipes]|nr:uncharacterized protein TNCV_3452671 [Trichonephila clavipes]
MEEYEQLGHMSPNKELDANISYFLPHHAVRRKDSITTKFKVVFDGSCKPPKFNLLNSVLGVGEILQPDTLLDHVINVYAWNYSQVVLFWLSSSPLPETGSCLSPIGHLKFWISYLVSNDVMFHRKGIQLTLAPEACHLKIYPTAAYGGRDHNDYLLKKPAPSNQL